MAAKIFTNMIDALDAFNTHNLSENTHYIDGDSRRGYKIFKRATPVDVDAARRAEATKKAEREVAQSLMITSLAIDLMTSLNNGR